MERKLWIDHARGICAFCVLLAHQTSMESITHLYNGFFLMLFFFISGYLHKNRNLKDSFKNILHSLLVPYLCLSLLGIFLYSGEIKLLFCGDVDYIISKTNDILMGRTLWFVSCLVCVRILFCGLHFLISIIGKWNSQVIFFISIIAILSVFFVHEHPADGAPFWYWTTSIYSLGFYILGYFCHRVNVERLMPKAKWYYGVLLLIGYTATSYLIQQYLNVEFHVYTDFFESPVIFIVLAVIGIFCVCMASYSLCNKMGGVINKYVIALGQNSLLLFAINGKVRLTVEKILSIVAFPSCFAEVKILLLCITQGVVILSIGYYINKYIPFVVGKHK